MTIKEEVILAQAKFPSRDQGLRPTCIAFALAEVNFDAATGVEALSPEYAYQGAACLTPSWVPGAGVPLDAALRASSKGQPVESDFPYRAVEPGAPVPAPPTTFELHGGDVAMLPLDTEFICAMLRQGRPVGIGLRLTESFYRPIDGLVTFEAAPLVPAVLHAVAVVGFGWEDGEVHFLIRNSWGRGWGQDGVAWVSATYVRELALCAFGA
ncbi:C1 family peptidase [Lysobacter gummosus]|uniref:C1 family peptidase n=1 Tax=Lysobacter gummosus TaxID=262324 RepID=A0ABY3XDP4_9GAMM|nr:C1 family peptidase [Lysobacter gummosus]UNP30069.1 C1 family peptidase [Lysobacter gummosus]